MEYYTTRQMKSLTLLTTKFIHLLENADNGELDLNHAITILGISTRRRLYDITCVLEGIGLIVKKSKRIVKLVVPLSRQTEHRLDGSQEKLKSEVEHLKQAELSLDQQMTWVQQGITNTKENCRNLTYVNVEDICNCFNGHTVLAVQAPSGTQLDVPIPKAVENTPTIYQAHLKSVEGPIDVVFMNKACIGSVPIILPIPPPEGILQKAKLAMLASEEKDSVSGPCSSQSVTQSCTSERMRTQHLHKSTCRSPELNRTAKSTFHELTKKLQDRLDKDLLRRLIASDVLPPLLPLSSSSREPYGRGLDESEGISSVYNVPALSV